MDCNPIQIIFPPQKDTSFPKASASCVWNPVHTYTAIVNMYGGEKSLQMKDKSKYFPLLINVFCNISQMSHDQKEEKKISAVAFLIFHHI